MCRPRRRRRSRLSWCRWRRLQADQKGNFVLVLGAGNKIVQTKVTLGDQIDQNFVVKSGLSAGQQVITDGIQKVKKWRSGKSHRRDRLTVGARKMFSSFFIHRPNFAIVIAVVITIAGLVALSVIPIAQYPNVTPPQVTISITYPGASAQTIANTIAEPVEEQVNGAPGMLYMQSSEASSGTYSLTVTFGIGTNPNIDQVNVQNRVQVAEAQLPAEVQTEGITVRAASSTQVLVVSLFFTDRQI